jgi:hypothetical protein
MKLDRWLLAALSLVLFACPITAHADEASVDATLFGFTAAAATPFFDTSVRQAAESFPNLVGFQWRMMDRYYEPVAAE